MTEELLETPIVMLKVKDLIGIIDSRLTLVKTSEPIDQDRYARSIKEFASFLKKSIKTASKIKNSGIIDGAVTQCGGSIIIDKEKALQLMRQNHE